jgi:regulator of protease activity HflC (stomatin/prohibitin superfamily)
MHTVRKVDIRTQFASIVGQEVLSADNVSIKMSLVASYKISDPHLAVNQTASYQQALYLLLQLCLRDLIGSTPIDELLSKREEIGQQLYEKAVDQVAELGVELSLVGIKDVMFPGDLKAIFAQVVNARKEGLAALERARGETAALRNLANAAKMLENNPALMQLRLLQAIGDQPGNTVILTSNLDEPVHLKLLQERTAKSQKE